MAEMETWLMKDKWWTDQPDVRAYCGCGWKTPNMVTARRAVVELNHHMENVHKVVSVRAA